MHASGHKMRRLCAWQKEDPSTSARLERDALWFLSPFSSLLPNSSIEHVGMDHLHQPVVVPVVYRYTDDNGSLHREGSLKRGRDLIGPFYLQSFSAKGVGKPDNIDWTEIH